MARKLGSFGWVFLRCHNFFIAFSPKSFHNFSHEYIEKINGSMEIKDLQSKLNKIF